MATSKSPIPEQNCDILFYVFEKIASGPSEYMLKCMLCQKFFTSLTRTRSLLYHLRCQHPVCYEEVKKKREQEKLRSKPTKAKAPKNVAPAKDLSDSPITGVTGTLASTKSENDETMNSHQALPHIGEVSSEHVNDAIVHWLAADMVHPSVVEKKGFRKFLTACGIKTDLPSKKTMSDTVISNLTEEIKSMLREHLGPASFVALSLETWIHRDTQTFLTITAHFFKENWSNTSYVLETFECPEDATAITLGTSLRRVTDEWDVTKDIVAVLSTFPDPVMSDAIAFNDWEELYCFSHLLNLVVNDALIAVTEWVRVHKKISAALTFFDENVEASDALAAVQQQHKLPTKRLKQEKPSLWMSVLATMTRLVEQYKAVNTVFGMLGRDTMCLYEDEMALVKDVIQVLNPFQDAVEELCTDSYPCVSKIIPIATLLQQVTEASIAPDDSGTQKALKSALLSQMKQHFANLENQPLLAAATLLDPRYKQHVFANTDALEAAQQRLLIDTQQLTSDSTENKTSAKGTSTFSLVTVTFDKTNQSEADEDTDALGAAQQILLIDTQQLVGIQTSDSTENKTSAKGTSTFSPVTVTFDKTNQSEANEDTDAFGAAQQIFLIDTQQLVGLLTFDSTENKTSAKGTSTFSPVTVTFDKTNQSEADKDTDALGAAQQILLIDTQQLVQTSDSTENKTSAKSTSSFSPATDTFDETNQSEADEETKRFFQEANILQTADPFQWWRLNEVRFPHLKVLATKFLSVPAISADSHKLFTKEGIAFSDRRDLFKPSQLNNMLFLNQNLSLT
ncbi:zinc finger BED domain-containing protein 4 [Elysia marginata]|uniref:Zinc finger BED domain-containing protein 4 n=1 Tax=Elysia marginata TaxID=1093978 RepID=A0AAV4GSA7_9GAST|nr:zinc finger BED domain-containing protein 4 [Elysia marginata]